MTPAEIDAYNAQRPEDGPGWHPGLCEAMDSEHGRCDATWVHTSNVDPPVRSPIVVGRAFHACISAKLCRLHRRVFFGTFEGGSK